MSIGSVGNIEEAEVGLDDADKLVIRTYEQDDFGSHEHKFFELVYVISGSARHVLNGKESRILTGDFFILDYGAVHSYQDCSGLALINCLFLPEIVDETLKGCRSFEKLLRSCLLRYRNLHMKSLPANQIFHDKQEQVLGLLQGMLSEYQCREIGYAEILKNRLVEIIILTLRYVVEDIPFMNTRNIVIEMIEYLNGNYQEKYMLQKFCKAYHYSKPYVSRRFKEETGMTIGKYCQKIRIKKSCDLLRGSGCSIFEISQEVGYQDFKTFGRLFKKSIGMSPRTYRAMKQHTKED